MVINKSFKLRIYPNVSQTILINKTFGCCRLLYNLHLEERLNFYKNNIQPIENKSERNKIWKTFKPKEVTAWKAEYSFMKEISSQALASSKLFCDNAFSNFFKSNNKSRKGFAGFPKFKSKKNRQSYRECMVNLSYLHFDEQKIKIPKLGFVTFRNKFKSKWFSQIKELKSITVEKSCSNRYYAVCLFEIENKIYPTQNRKDSIGLDFSPSECYVDSDGKTGKDYGYVAQKQKNKKKLTKLQRRLARKVKGSKNRDKARIKLARFEEYIADCRRDWIEKETLRLVKSYDKVVVEDLNLKGISKFLSTAKNMTDTSWGTFVNRLEQKGQDYDCQVVKADRWFPSSQLCSNCGYQHHDLKLSERTWICPSCDKFHVRDVNAAINLKRYVPQELRKLMPVEDMEGVEKLASLALEYPLKQESHLSLVSA